MKREFDWSALENQPMLVHTKEHDVPSNECKEKYEGKCFKDNFILYKVEKVTNEREGGILLGTIVELNLYNLEVNRYYFDYIDDTLEPVDSSLFDTIKERLDSYSITISEERQRCTNDITKILENEY